MEDEVIDTIPCPPPSFPEELVDISADWLDDTDTNAFSEVLRYGVVERERQVG